MSSSPSPIGPDSFRAESESDLLIHDCNIGIFWDFAGNFPNKIRKAKDMLNLKDQLNINKLKTELMH